MSNQNTKTMAGRVGLKFIIWCILPPNGDLVSFILVFRDFCDYACMLLHPLNKIMLLMAITKIYMHYHYILASYWVAS